MYFQPRCFQQDVTMATLTWRHLNC